MLRRDHNWLTKPPWRLILIGVLVSFVLVVLAILTAQTGVQVSNHRVANERVEAQAISDSGELAPLPHPIGNGTADTGNIAPRRPQMTRPSSPQRSGRAHLIDQGDDAEQTDLESDLSTNSLNRDLTISGRVLNQFGQPVYGVDLVAEARSLFQLPDGSPIPEDLRKQRVTSASNGTYSITRLAAGEYEIRAQTMDNYSAPRVIVRAGLSSVDLVMMKLIPTHRMFGKVMNSVGIPLADVLIAPSHLPGYVVRSATDGRYELQLAEPRRQANSAHSIRFSSDGYLSQHISFDDINWKTRHAVRNDIYLEPIESYGVVKGRMTDFAGAPIAGETVQLYSPSLKRHYRAISGSDGEFIIPKVPTGDDYRVWIRPSQDHRDYIQHDLNVTAGTVTLDVKLRQLNFGDLTAQCVDVEGNAVSGFTLLLRSQDTLNQSLRVTSGDDGYFVVDDAPSGALVFETNSSPHFTIQGAYLPPGGKQHISLVLDWGSYTLQGRIIDRQGAPVAASNVNLTWAHSDHGLRSLATRRAAADADGYFRFSNLGYGQHTLNVRAPGFEAKHLDYEVGAHQKEVLVYLE